MRAAIAGARITAVRSGEPAAASVVSDWNGEFSLPLDAGGLRGDRQLRRICRCDPDRSPWVESSNETSDFILQVAGFTDAVNVTASRRI
jgi:hypothetical protein